MQYNLSSICFFFFWLRRVLVAAGGLLSFGMHVGSSSLTRDQTHIPCIGRWILNHCTTREVPQYNFRSFIITYLIMLPCNLTCQLSLISLISLFEMFKGPSESWMFLMSFDERKFFILVQSHLSFDS